jgi:hypothetical protein
MFEAVSLPRAFAYMYKVLNLNVHHIKSINENNCLRSINTTSIFRCAEYISFPETDNQPSDFFTLIAIDQFLANGR